MPAPKGNKNATKEHRLITNALRRAVVQNPEKLAKACMKVLDDAEDGNLASFNAIADRLDGKPAQTQILEGGENPIKTESEVKLPPLFSQDEWLKHIENR